MELHPRPPRRVGSDPVDLDAVVIERALAGQRTYFRRFYDRYAGTVRLAVGRRVRRWPTLAPMLDDIVQEVWAQLLRRQGKLLRYFAPERGTPFWRFLALVSGRLGWQIAKQRLDRPAERHLGGIAQPRSEIGSSVVDRDLLQRITRLVNEQLGPDDQVMFEEHYLRGETIKHVGAQLGLCENTAHQRKHRLAKKLMRMREQLLEGRPPARARNASGRWQHDKTPHAKCHRLDATVGHRWFGTEPRLDEHR
ncbi:MAG: sigma-70 family RNA polymerase sigma factor [Deltaproteobacteria bacterium]|nr:sigma-70 family RNA polymerase sigma factor [Deltaproteobacteria bacterium]